MTASEESGPKPRLMTQKDIEVEFGIPTRDILSAVQRLQFPMPVQITGKKRWFRRSDILKFFKLD
jgi:hypothetical protein